jgi:hypothetical protein
MCGFPDGTFYTVGEAGTVIQYNGTFVQQVTPTREDLHGVFALSPSDIYACGFNGTLIHFNGTNWTTIETPTHEDLFAVWASGANDVFVAGTNGRVLDLKSGVWTEYVVVPGQRLRALWGYSHSEVYASGSKGSLYRFDGSAWTRIIVFDNPNFDAEVYDLWGPAPGSISLVDRFDLTWFNGTWHAIALHPSNGLGLFGFALNQQIVVSNGLTEHLIGNQLTSFATQTQEPLFDVWGRSMSDCSAVGRSGSIEHFDGAAWQALNHELLADVHDVSPGPGGAVAVGNDGLILRHNGSTWSNEGLNGNYELAGVWQTNGLAVAVGRYAPNKIDWRQAILMNTVGSWSDIGPVGTAQRLFDVWGSSAGNVYAVGWGGEILHYDGNQWNISDPGSGNAAYLLSIYGSSANDILAVGRTNDLHALVCRFNGTSWVKTTVTNTEELRGVWVEDANSAFAVGSRGAIRHYSNGSWTAMSSPTNEELLCVYGTSGSNVYAAGWRGTLIHYDGSVWRTLLPSTHRNINAIAGSSPTGLYLVGERGSVWQYGGLTTSVASNR